MEILAIPVLACAELDRALRFYGALGFELIYEQEPPEPYAILRLGRAEIHLAAGAAGAGAPGEAGSLAGCYLQVPDADAIHHHWVQLGLPESGVPSLGLPADRPWGMREFTLVDPDGNRIRVGRILD